MSTSGAGIAVVGGGVIGLAVAWRCAEQGLAVTLYDAGEPGASPVAAGLLAPVNEAYFGEGPLTALMLDSARRWPGFAADLARYGDTGYRAEGTLTVARTRDDWAEVDRLLGYQETAGLPVTRLTAGALREREPALHPGVRGGALAGADHQADPRRLLPVLRSACEAAGVAVVTRRVGSLAELTEPTVVVAAGCGSATLADLPVRPVKGQVVRLRRPTRERAGLRHVVRGWADGRPIYVVPRDTGEVVVGATQEERGDTTPTAGAVLELLRAATDLVPELVEYTLVEVTVGLRPGTPDNGPLLGRLDERTLVATGHYRHGILLAPVTADAIAGLVTTGSAPEVTAPFRPARFRREVPRTEVSA